MHRVTDHLNVWDEIEYFSKSEFPPPTDVVDPQLFYSLDAFRNILGSPIYPSPVNGALARDYGSKDSRHYVGDPPERLCDAVDVFCDASTQKVFLTALYSKLWGGIGVYFDTKYKGKQWDMFHLDLRSSPVIWFRIDGEYKYPMNDNGAMNQLFSLLNIGG